MSEEIKKKKWCPFHEEVECLGNDGGCMAWREMDHNDWDCALIRNKTCQ